MKDEEKTKEELISEIQALRLKNRELSQELLNLRLARKKDDMETLLVVDDNEDTRNVIVRMLEESGYTLLDAHSSSRAIEIFKTHEDPIHLVLADVVMPDMNGPKMVSELMKIQPDIKVVFMSGYAEDEIVHDDVFNVLHSHSSFIKKPFNCEEIGLIVRQQLEQTP